MPSLYILGGANGVGKTTWYQTGVENNSINAGLPFINIDTLVLHELGGYTSENITRAEQMAKERMTVLIRERRDFMIESNLSKSADYDWIELMRKNGYNTVLFFLGTNNVEINKMRVQARVREGGHSVADSIIEQRYQMGLTYIKSKVLSFTETIFIDMSSDRPREIAYLKEGLIISKADNCPEWVEKSLHIAERLEQKSKQLRKPPSEDF